MAPTSPPAFSPAALAERMRALGVPPGARVLVAISGGADSVVLLHALRAAGLWRLSAAHFDHRMRACSAADADWTGALCASWGIPLERGAATTSLRSEADARDARYTFLREVQRRAGALWLATAHHADDQAETVLLRMARGTGVTGLRGILPRGPAGLVRPLLGWPRGELRRYAACHALKWRDDPSNAEPGPVRNRVRALLAALPEALATRLREALCALAAHALELDHALESRAQRALAGAATAGAGGVMLERGVLAAYDSALAARVLRAVLRGLGLTLDRPGTRSALQFITSGPSGRTMRLPGGRLAVHTEFGCARIAPLAPPLPDRPVTVAGPAGQARARLGGRGVRVHWWTGDGAPDAAVLALAAAPFTVRAWRPGDRLRTAAGTKLLKKLFNEARIPRAERAATPVVVDAAGHVVWVHGVSRTPRADAGAALHLRIF